MNKNTIDKLANNPHYVMSNDEIERMAELLKYEADAQKEDERISIPETAQGFTVPEKINKNRVKKNMAKIDKHIILGE